MNSISQPTVGRSITTMNPVLCLIAQHEACNEAWAAWLCDRPMSWLPVQAWI